MPSAVRSAVALPRLPPGHATFNELASWFQLVTGAAVECVNAVAVVAVQLSDRCEPAAFQFGVRRLGGAVALVDWNPLDPDPYAHRHVTIPGLFWEGDGGREAIHGTSYHDVAIRLACGLYECLAGAWLEYAKISLSPHFDEAGTISWADVPDYRDFPEKEWPAEFADKVIGVARALNPTIDAGLLATELKLENSRAIRQLARMSERDTTGVNERASPTARPAATPPDPYDELAALARREFGGKSLATVLEVCNARGEIELAKLNRLLNGLATPRGWPSLDKAERGVKDVIIGIKQKLLKITTPGWVLSQKNDKVFLTRQEPSPARP